MLVNTQDQLRIWPVLLAGFVGQAVNNTMIVVNLQQLGLVPHKLCSREELAVILSVAEEIMGTTETDVLAEILTEWETALIWRSLESEPVSEEWYYRALLLTCIRGLQGEISPDFYTIP